MQMYIYVLEAVGTAFLILDVGARLHYRPEGNRIDST
jgi:hypothetical protein